CGRRGLPVRGGPLLAGDRPVGGPLPGGPTRPERLLTRRLPFQAERRQSVRHLPFRRDADAVGSLPAVLALGARLRRLLGAGPPLRSADGLGAVGEALRLGCSSQPLRLNIPYSGKADYHYISVGSGKPVEILGVDRQGEAAAELDRCSNDVGV